MLGAVDMHDWQFLTSSLRPLRGGATWQESFSGRDTIVAWRSEVWLIEKEAWKQAREDEEEDEVLRQLHLPHDICGVLEQGDFDGTS